MHDEASEVQNESIYKRVLQYDNIWVGGGQPTVPLAHVTAQVKNLRAQEELDLPVPEKVEQALLEAEVDLATMRAIMAHWVSPEQFSNGDMDDEAALMTKYEHPGVGAEEGTVKAETGKFFRERILSEYCRVQQLTNGNRNEVWRRRCEGVMKGFQSVL